MRRTFQSKVGVGQDDGSTITLSGSDLLSIMQTLAPYYTGTRPGPAPGPATTGMSGGAPGGGSGLVPLGPDPGQQAIDLAMLKYQQEQQLQAQQSSQASSQSAQSSQQAQALQNEKFQHDMALQQASQVDANNPYASLLPKYGAPTQVPGPNGAMSIFDPNTGQLVPIYQEGIRNQGGNLIIPPGQSAQVYYAGNKGQPTNVSGGPGQQPQQMPFSALAQAGALAPIVQQYAQQNRQQQGMGGQQGGMGGYGGRGQQGMGGRSFGGQQGMPQQGGQMGGRTFGQPQGYPQFPMPQPQTPPVPQVPQPNVTDLGQQWLDQILAEGGGE